MFNNVLFLLIAKRAKRTVDVTAIDAHSEAEADSEQELKAATIKEAAALILPSQVNSLVEAYVSSFRSFNSIITRFFCSGLKQAGYLEESSSCSEIGKEAAALETHEAACSNAFLAIHPRTAEYVVLFVDGNKK